MKLLLSLPTPDKSRRFYPILSLLFSLLIALQVSALPLQKLNGSKSLPVKPGQEVTEALIKQYGVDAFFCQTPISDAVLKRMRDKSLPQSATVSPGQLRYLTCLHINAQGRTFLGEIVVNKQIATDILQIFRQLYEAAYPIERMVLIDNYGADDDASMRANNTSGFNYRFVAGTSTVSKHGQGLAIDINPFYNPYVKQRKDGKLIVRPANASAYTNRSKKSRYMIQKGDLCYRLFTARGFVWGGAWRSCKDYQHFELK